MANTNAPFGFRPVRWLGGITGNFEPVEYQIASTNTNVIATGDTVKALVTGYIDLNTTASTDAFMGVFIGCKYLSSVTGSTEWSKYWPGSGATGDVTAQVLIDPNIVFECQTGNGGPAVFADRFANFEIHSGTSANGLSQQYLDYATIATTASLPFKLHRVLGLISPETTEFDATTQYNIVQVTINHSMFHAGVAGLTT